MLTLLLVLFGLSLVIDKAPGGKWFLKQTKNAALRPIKAGWKAVKAEVKTVAQNFWCAHRERVWSFFFGAGIAGVALSPIGFWWTLFLALITLGGLLAALAFTTWRGAQDDFRDWVMDLTRWTWQNYATQIRWGVTGAIALTILKLA